MKNKKWIKFKNGYTRLIMLVIVSLGAGLGMLIAPDKTSDWVIRGVGLIWTMDGISYVLDIMLKHQKRRMEGFKSNKN